jgi:hypothetical protein
MDIVLRLVGYMGVLLSAILMGVMLLAARKEMRLRLLGLFVSVLVEIAFLVVFLLISGATLYPVVMVSARWFVNRPDRPAVLPGRPGGWKQALAGASSVGDFPDPGAVP